MSAYVIVEIDIVDPAGYEEYKKLAGETVEKYGGKYVIRGGAVETLEGNWKPKRIVVLQFDSMQHAQRTGSIAKSTANRVRCGIAPREREWWSLKVFSSNR